MPYTVRKNKLHFEPNVGNGPCKRRDGGKYDRRILSTVVREGREYRCHATKGWRPCTPPPAVQL
jgi:hypothetical protein